MTKSRQRNHPPQVFLPLPLMMQAWADYLHDLRSAQDARASTALF